eukprot:TRINITY_DN9341_c0_g1_i2.p1 TRINITY_DN9341_c0_g1~~TRINITY_DN9341_c0_g1_i2.p1  ORF type:complete len:374 (+),score=41.18 TRINITY_DN9341_c0_g1_i2:58-1179(+)
MSAIYFVLFAITGLCGGFQVPNAFLGRWQGQVQTSPIGPIGRPYTFDIIETSYGWLMSDEFLDNSTIDGSKQQFYVYRNGTMKYCGLLANFFKHGAVPITTIFYDNDSTDTQLSWCMRGTNCTSSWTITNKSGSLHSVFYHPQPVKHLEVDLDYIGPAPQDAPPSICTAKREISDRRAPGKSHYGTANVMLGRDGAKEKRYHFCYKLNKALDVRLNWTLTDSYLTATISTSRLRFPQYSWIAIGFMPEFPTMQGMDIVMGYVTYHGACIRTMYAEQPVGTPIDSHFNISKQRISATDGVLSLSFTRPLTTGHTSIPTEPQPLPNPSNQIMWAIGAAPTSCSGLPGYHFSDRGARAMDWTSADAMFSDSLKCDN